MAFMKQQIQKGSWLLIDGPCGVDVVPADLFSLPVLNSFGHTGAEWTVTPDSEGFADLWALARQYTEENSEAYSIEMKRGYGARFSAPGYMDCTPWCVFETEAEAQAYLDDQEEADDDQGDEEADDDQGDEET